MTAPHDAPSPAPRWRALARRVWWRALHLICFFWVGTCYGYRAFGQQRLPADGPLLLVSNHQSFLDPILVGLAVHQRPMYAMARATLWRSAWLGRLIDSLNAIPVERGSADTAAMRRCLEVLGRGEALLLFPEGTRTQDGTTGAFASGTMLLIKRAAAAVVPVAIEGAFDAWPRHRKLPRPFGRVRVAFGQPIFPQELVPMGPDRALALLRDRIETMRRNLKRV